MERLTEKSVGCFKYALKDHKAVPGEFGTYEAFYDYSMAVMRLGEYEEIGLSPEEVLQMVENVETRCLLWFEKKYGEPAGTMMGLLEAYKEGRLIIKEPT